MTLTAGAQTVAQAVVRLEQAGSRAMPSLSEFPRTVVVWYLETGVQKVGA